MTPEECEKEHGHVWEYHGDVGLAIRKCSYCLLKQEILGVWRDQK